MNTGMVKKLYEKLCINYNKQKDIEQCELWNELFGNEDPLLLERAVKKIINEDKYFPSVARIREVLNEQSNIPLTKEEKLKRWKKEGITPSCLSKEPEETQISEEELEELEDFFEVFKC